MHCRLENARDVHVEQVERVSLLPQRQRVRHQGGGRPSLWVGTASCSSCLAGW